MFLVCCILVCCYWVLCFRWVWRKLFFVVGCCWWWCVRLMLWWLCCWCCLFFVFCILVCISCFWLYLVCFCFCCLFVFGCCGLVVFGLWWVGIWGGIGCLWLVLNCLLLVLMCICWCCWWCCVCKVLIFWLVVCKGWKVVICVVFFLLLWLCVFSGERCVGFRIFCWLIGNVIVWVVCVYFGCLFLGLCWMGLIFVFCYCWILCWFMFIGSIEFGERLLGCWVWIWMLCVFYCFLICVVCEIVFYMCVVGWRVLSILMFCNGLIKVMWLCWILIVFVKVWIV